MKKQLIGAVVASMVVTGTIGATTLLQYTNYETESASALTTYSDEDGVIVQSGDAGSLKSISDPAALHPKISFLEFSWDSYTIDSDGVISIKGFSGDTFSGFYHSESYINGYEGYSMWNGGLYTGTSDLKYNNYLKINEKDTDNSFEIQEIQNGSGPIDVEFNIGKLPLAGEIKSFKIYADHTDENINGHIDGTTSREWGAGDYLYTFNFKNTGAKVGENVYSLELVETFISEDFEKSSSLITAGIVFGSLVVVGLMAGGGYYLYTTKRTPK